MKIGGESLNTRTWSQLLNFLKHFLAGGFVKQMQENEVLHDIFGFSPKRKVFSGTKKRLSGTEKRSLILYVSPSECTHPRSPSLTLGLIAVVALVNAQTIITVATGCLCYRRGPY